jgi:hypothetical protein
MNGTVLSGESDRGFWDVVLFWDVVINDRAAQSFRL